MKRKLYKAAALLLAASFLPMRCHGAPKTSAKCSILMDADTGAVLFAENETKRALIASTTKIMTAVVVLEHCDADREFVIPAEATGIEGSSMYLRTGECLTVRELLYGLMLQSGNDAAVALALACSGSVEAFVAQMNTQAQKLGMEDSHFENPNGLDGKTHYSTALDMAKLTRYAMKNEAFRVFSETKKMTISAPNDSKRYLSNHNKLLRMYDCCIGGKTGFTKEAGRCLVTAAEKNGRLLVCATLGDPNDWMDHVSLFEYGFSLYNEKQIVSSEGISAQVPVVGGDEKSVEIRNYEGFSYWLKQNEKFEYTIEAPRFLYADVREGETIGSVVYSLNGKEIKRLELIASKSVLKQNIRLSFWQRILQIIRLWMD